LEFVCKVGTPGGEVMEQTFSAPDEASLRAQLEQQGIYLFNARRRLGLNSAFGGGRPRIPLELVILFGQELAALMKAGLPLLQSLDVMLERQRNPVFRQSLATVRDKVKTGVALSDAFRQEGELYPPMLSASLVAGERSGSLETVLRRLVVYLKLTQSLRKKAISAAVYPALLFTAMIALVVVMMVWVIPQFQGFFEGLGVKLPLPTRVMMAVSSGLAEHFVWILAGLAAVVFFATRWSRSEGSALVKDRLLLRVPYLGGILRMYATSQLCRTLSTLLQGGLPLLTALEVAASSLGNRAMSQAVRDATPQIREGRSLTVALESTGILENVALEMIKVGEQTGALGDMLTAIADFYDEDLETRMATLLTLVEPVMLVFMAFIVAGMLLAFYLPLFEAISAVERQ
jgi:type IV pilus assembly protein PilC